MTINLSKSSWNFFRTGKSGKKRLQGLKKKDKGDIERYIFFKKNDLILKLSIESCYRKLVSTVYRRGVLCDIDCKIGR